MNPLIFTPELMLTMFVLAYLWAAACFPTLVITPIKKLMHGVNQLIDLAEAFILSRSVRKSR
jgi:hypothetical protein